MEIQWRHYADMLETNWKHTWRQNLQTNMETTVEIDGAYRKTKCALLHGKMITKWNQNGDQYGDKVDTKWSQHLY